MIPSGYCSSCSLPVAAALLLCCLLFSCGGGKTKDITVAGLLDEMISIEEGARYPAIPYRALSTAGRAEEVLFDKRGPGVITRILLASEDKEGIVRFYFDGASGAEISLPAYDLSLMDMNPLEGMDGLLYSHTNHHPETAAGSTLYLPLPYEKSCRITLEQAGSTAPRYYRIDYRQYPENTSVETFSLKKLIRIKKKIAETNHALLHPEPCRNARDTIRGETLLEGGAPVVIKLPRGENAVYELHIHVTAADEDYAQTLRNLVLQGIFDGKQTVRAPVADFSGGGMRASAVESRYLSADGKGAVLSRWLMPYMEKASLAFINEGRKSIQLRYTVLVAPLPWDERMLYFHASWKEETGIPLDPRQGKEWDFASISGGKGVYKGDALSLYNPAQGWYGKGNNRITTDSNPPSPTAESPIGHYYNQSQQPPATFQTPFGGMPLAGTKNSPYGNNTFLRIRLLDGIPFTNRFHFDMEWLGEKTGTIDCATTIFWYGNQKARPGKTSQPDVTARTLPSPTVSGSAEPDNN